MNKNKNGKNDGKTLRKKFLIYPEDRFKKNWDMLITLTIVFTCVYVPYNLAFQQSDDTNS